MAPLLAKVLKDALWCQDNSGKIMAAADEHDIELNAPFSKIRC